MVGDYLVEQGNESNLSAKERQDILNRAKLVAGTVALAVGADVDTAANSAGVAVENNSLKVATTVIKVSGKVFKVAVKKGKVSIKDLKDVLKDTLKEEGLDIVDNLITLSDGEVNINDAKAIIDLVVGTSLNKANKGEAALRINSMISPVSKTTIKHITNRHDPNSIKKQLDVLVKQKGLSPSQAYDKLQLGNRTYFNKAWTTDTIVKATDFAKNEAINKGVIGKPYKTNYRGETITILVQNDGKISTAYGSRKYKLSDFGY